MRLVAKPACCCKITNRDESGRKLLTGVEVADEPAIHLCRLEVPIQARVHLIRCHRHPTLVVCIRCPTPVLAIALQLEPDWTAEPDGRDPRQSDGIPVTIRKSVNQDAFSLARSSSIVIIRM